jgi:hypothetical protein
VFSLQPPTAQGAGLKKFLVSGLIRVTCIIWSVFGYFCGREFLVVVLLAMLCMAKDKKKLG